MTFAVAAALSGLGMHREAFAQAVEMDRLKAIAGAVGASEAQFDKWVALAHGEAASDPRNGMTYYLERRINAFAQRGTE